MNILIFGFGSHGGGFNSAKYYLKHGHSVRITDLKKPQELGDSINYLQELGAKVIMGEHREEDFLWADVVIKSPAIKASNPLLRLSKKIATDFTELFKFPRIKEIKLIAITGTKGKTTTASLTAHLLNSFNKEAILCGNMGISAFCVLAELEERNKLSKPLPAYIVCELSSWQIADIYSYNEANVEFEANCLTCIFEDHQNYYANMEAYVNDKLKLFTFPSLHIISFDPMRKAIAQAAKTKISNIVSIEKNSKKIEDLSYAPAICIAKSLGFKLDEIIKYCKSFKGVAHRNELVGHFENIIFINDSSATVPQAVSFTFNNYYCNYPVFLITGGTDKALHPESMLETCKKAKKVILLNGSYTQKKLIPLLEKNSISYLGPFDNMKVAFEQAVTQAKNFESQCFILLSPGAASFELFKHEFDRGDQFRKLTKDFCEKSLV